MSSAPSDGVLARPRVERLRAVGERVHGRADRLRAREAERQRRLVDDADRVRARPARLHASRRVPHAEVRRPLRARVRRRNRDQRQARAADTALDVSIALPPPSPTSPSDSRRGGGRGRDDLDAARAAERPRSAP